MRTALVFGGSGQLGRAMAEQLLTSRWRVMAVTRDGRVLPEMLTDLGAERLDGTGKSRALIIQEIARPVDAIFDPTAYTEADAHDLLRARAHFGRLVVVSSSSVYRDREGRSLDEAAETGFPDFGGPISESTPTVAPGPQTYSARKVAMELALLDSDVAVSVLRPCAIYGMGATHPREWWFIKRALDARRLIPVAFGARSVFHTSSARGIASLAAACMETAESRLLNVADRTALSVEAIAAAIAGVTGLTVPLKLFEGSPVGPSHVGSTPWSAEQPFVLDTSRAQGLGWNGGEYREHVAEVCRWILDVARSGNWRAQFSQFAHYGYEPFDYAAEDRFLTAA